MKVVNLDIEKSPLIVATYDIHDPRLTPAHILVPGRMMCMAWKWDHEKKVRFVSEFHDGREQMVKTVHSVLEEADVVVHYYGEKFDVPNINTEFALFGIPQPAPFHQVDLYKTVKRKFKFASNSLAHVLQQLGLGKKLDSGGMATTLACMGGDPKAWARFKRYCIGDVTPLPALRDFLRSWLVDSPNLRLTLGDVCPRCGAPGENLRLQGHRYTQTGKYQRLRCDACSGWSVLGRREEGTDMRAIP